MTDKNKQRLESIRKTYNALLKDINQPAIEDPEEMLAIVLLEYGLRLQQKYQKTHPEEHFDPDKEIYT